MITYILFEKRKRKVFKNLEYFPYIFIKEIMMVSSGLTLCLFSTVTKTTNTVCLLAHFIVGK